MNTEFFVGSYAPKGRSSIYRYSFDESEGKLYRKWAYNGADNPSWVLPHPNGKILYSVEELNPEGRIASYRILEDGLERLDTLPSGGSDPCHLSLDDQARFLFASNYSSGSLSVFRLNAEGRILEMCDHLQHTGHSVYAARQEEAHVHFSRYTDGILYVCDLGEDLIYRCRLDRDSGRLLTAAEPLTVPAGFGPRHLVDDPADPGKIYVVTEMGASLLAYSHGKPVQNICALPPGKNIDDYPTGSSRAIGAAIRITEDGSRILLSLRGVQGIAVFCSDGNTGMFRLKGVFPSGGNTPRDFMLTADYVLAANQDSDRISVLRWDKSSGTLTDTGYSEKIEKPVCINGLY